MMRPRAAARASQPRTMLLVILSLLPLAAIALMLGVNSWRTIERKTEAEVELYLSGASTTAAWGLSSWLNDRLDAISHLATLYETQCEGPIAECELLPDPEEFDAYIDYIYAGSEEGEFALKPHVDMPEGYDPRERPYYKAAAEADGVRFVMPYRGATTNELLVSIAAPIRDGDRLRGVVAADLVVESVATLLDEVSHSQPLFLYVAKADGRPIMGPTGMTAETLLADEDGVAHFAVSAPIDLGSAAQLQMIAARPAADMRAQIASERAQMVQSIGGIWASICALMFFLLHRSIVKPMEVRTARAQLASDAKSEFLAHISHEIRTPLNGVLGTAQALAEGPLDHEQKAQVDQIRDSGELLLCIVNDVLDLSKIEANKLDVVPVAANLGDVVESTVGMYRESALQKGLTLRVQVAEGLPERLMFDDMRLRQCVANLVSNAIKFTAEGSVTVTAGAEPSADGLYKLWVRVTDTGIGIRPDVQETLFAAFTQGDSSTTRRFGGTGLGLAIVSRLAELMGGGVTVSSEEGRGSTFTLTLLAARAVPEAAAEEPQRAVDFEDAGPLDVMVVDDVRVNRIVAAALIKERTSNIREAEHGLEALEMLEAGYRPDVILADIQMPVLDGEGLIERLRQHPEFSGIAVVAVTAHALLGERERLFALGFDGFVTKPLERQALIAEMYASIRQRDEVQVSDHAVA